MIPQAQPLPPSIEAVLKLAFDYNPMLATKDISTVYMWLNAGCDMAKDILPCVREIVSHRPKWKTQISTFSYFTNAVLSARDKRLAIPKEDKPKTPVSIESRVKNYAWKRSRNMWLAPSEDKALCDYEQLHGRVEA